MSAKATSEEKTGSFGADPISSGIRVTTREWREVRAFGILLVKFLSGPVGDGPICDRRDVPRHVVGSTHRGPLHTKVTNSLESLTHFLAAV